MMLSSSFAISTQGGTDDRIITRAIERLEDRLPESDFDEQRTQGPAESLSSFHDSLDEQD